MARRRRQYTLKLEYLDQPVIVKMREPDGKTYRKLRSEARKEDGNMDNWAMLEAYQAQVNLDGEDIAILDCGLGLTTDIFSENERFLANG